MITTAELHRVAEEEGLRFDQSEKDYIILWLLSGLAHSGMATHEWIFKGGTCLRHCYYEGYRFSEDIDFSCKPGGNNLDASLRLLKKAAGKIQSVSGIRLTIKEPLTIPGDFQIEIPIEYSRGGSETCFSIGFIFRVIPIEPDLYCLRLDIASPERLLLIS
ncbi:MAG TPA: hypothetical protein ENH40_04100 [Nitrospirae bacterium]|nr:hypothetical protein [Nitrospirota bacterium]